MSLAIIEAILLSVALTFEALAASSAVSLAKLVPATETGLGIFAAICWFTCFVVNALNPVTSIGWLLFAKVASVPLPTLTLTVKVPLVVHEFGSTVTLI